MSSTLDGSRYATTHFSVNGRTYRPPARPVVVICIDGCQDAYLDEALARGRMPRVAHLVAGGWRGLVRGALPSFTNVNNACIVTGAPPTVTGIAGNFFLDPDSGEEVMMNSSRYLRCDTLLAAAARAGRRVAMVTAKDKLRSLLTKDLEGIAFSVEKAGEARRETHGIDDVEALVGAPAPDIYSGEASLFVLEAGAVLLEAGLADFLYLTLSDYVQHKHAPHEEQALAFYAGMDLRIGRLLDAGAVVGITADHGMNGKTDARGEPKVIYLETALEQAFGPIARVVCTITDPYVVHHGALGGLVNVHLHDPARAAEVARWTLDLEGVTEVYERDLAARKLELPADRIGDLVVLAGRDWVLGRTEADHDLSQLGGIPLRSHGGRYEEMVPLLLSEPLSTLHARRAAGDPRSFEVFEFACGGTGATPERRGSDGIGATSDGVAAAE